MTDDVTVCGQEPAGNFVGFMTLRWTVKPVAVDWTIRTERGVLNEKRPA